MEKEFKHLDYEFVMFKKTFRLLYINSCKGLRVIFLECFLLHARNILYFLGDWKGKNDIRCSDFGIKPLVDIKSKNTKACRILFQIEKRILHITKTRMKGPSILWTNKKVEEIYKYINHNYLLFIKELKK